MPDWFVLYSAPAIALTLIVWERLIGAPRTDWWINLQSWFLKIFGAFTVYGAVQAWHGSALIDGASQQVPTDELMLRRLKKRRSNSANRMSNRNSTLPNPNRPLRQVLALRPRNQRPLRAFQPVAVRCLSACRTCRAD